MKRIKNIFPEIYDFENLLGAHKDGSMGKRYRPDVLEYTAHKEENLIELQNEFMWGTYKVGTYRMFYVYEPKKRLIMSLQFKDRIAQHAIYRKLNPILDKQLIYDTYACRKGKGTHKAVKQLQKWMRKAERKGKYYYLKLDISKYFYRIDHEILLKILDRKIADKDLMKVFEEIINCEDTKFGLPMGADISDVSFEDMLLDVGLPIGNLTSQMFANLYLNELDQFAKHKLHLKYYIRYMDDIIIIHEDKRYLKYIKDQIEEYLNTELHLQLNKKTCIRPCSMGIEFVGFRVWTTHIKMRKKTVKKIKKRLKFLFGLYAVGEIDRETLNRTLASYRGMMKHFNSYSLRQSLNEMFIKQCYEKTEGKGHEGIIND